ncbi:MAG: glycosyltransferase family 2 protein [Deltaproteobacteria bacterium]|nr:glycosyltransferase family 2 protein [Deltaproteobacteria bacterium]
MRVHVYSCCWNEIAVAEFFIRHYESFVERIVIYDEDSTDGTREFLQTRPKVELRRFVRSNANSFELSKQTVQNQSWKESRGEADYVIIVDIDEHIFHPNITEYLTEQKHAGVTIVPTLGFQMVAEDFPSKDEHLASTRTIGFPDYLYSKPCLFDPKAIEEINLGVGSHSARPNGRVNIPERDELLLLHYKYLGFEYLSSRYKQLAPRIGSVDVKNHWDVQFFKSPEECHLLFAEAKGKVIDIAAPEFSPSRLHAKPSWRRVQNGHTPADFIAMAPE